MRSRKRWVLVLVPAVVAVGLLLIPLSLSLASRSTNSDGPLGSALSFLLARPALAQTSPAFPDDQAGISAYIKFSPGAITLDDLVTGLFTGMTYAGDNYVIGQFSEPRVRIFTTKQNSVTVSLYADTEGWLVAYLPRDRLTSEILLANSSDETWKSVLAKALDRAAKASGAATADINEDTVGYYHWAFPQATDLATAMRSASGNLYFAIPGNATVYDVSAATSCLVLLR